MAVKDLGVDQLRQVATLVEAHRLSAVPADV